MVTTEIHENEQQATSQITTIMGTLVQQMCQIAVVEAECTLLRNMVLNLSKGDQSGASNQRQSVNSDRGEFKETRNGAPAC